MTNIKFTSKQKNDISKKIAKRLFGKLDDLINKEMLKYDKNDIICANDYINIVLNAINMFNANFLLNLRNFHKKKNNINLDLATILLNMHEGLVLDIATHLKKENMN